MTVERGRRGIQSHPHIRVAGKLFEWDYHPIGNTLASFGALRGSLPAQYSSVVTLGTTGFTEVYTKLVDPGVDVKLLELDAELTGVFENIDAAHAIVVNHYWRARVNSLGTQQAWLNLTGTVSKTVPTDGVANDIATIPMRGRVNVGSLGEIPFDVSLMAAASVADGIVGKVKNTTHLDLVGIVIPGA